MKIFFRVDASYEIGNGHVIRCLTLANYLRDYNHKISFITQNLDGNLVKLIKINGFATYKLNSSYKIHLERELSKSEQKEDAKKTSQIFKNYYPDLIVVDHYALGYEWEKLVKLNNTKILVIDDLANRKHYCDYLLDQNYFIKIDRYKNFVPKKCIILEGPRYCLLRKQFLSFNPKNRSNKELRNLLVMFGGTDPNNITYQTIDVLDDSLFKSLHVDVVVGENNPNINEIKNRLLSVCFKWELHIQISNVAEIMKNIDLAIGSGGSTTWERLYFKIPSIVFIESENQKAFCTGLAKSNYIITINNNIEGVSKLRKYVCDILYGKINLNNKTLVDGNGCSRVVEIITND